MVGLHRRVLGRDSRLSGTIRVAMSGVMLQRLGAPMAAFAGEYPGIELSVVTGETYVSLTKREADVAIRAANSPPRALVGRRICRLAMAPYAGLDYLETATGISDLQGHSWVRLDESWAHVPMERWITSRVPAGPAHVRASSGAALQEMVAHGCGVGWLACYIAEPDPRLARVGEPQPDFASAIWVLTHEDLRRTARIRRFMQWMSKAIAEDQAVSEGTQLAPCWSGKADPGTVTHRPG